MGKRFGNDIELFTGKKVECKYCGWPRRFHHKDTDRLICNNCHRWVYKDEQTELKYKNKEEINKLKTLLLF